MRTLNRLTMAYPVGMTCLLVLLAIVISQLGAVLLTNIVTNIDRATFALFTRYGTALLMITLLWKLNALSESGISKPMNQWGKKWPLATLPMMLVACFNLSGIEWSNLIFSIDKIPFWVFENLATGVFEEVMMRAMAFFILYRAWQHQNNGLLKAAAVQALIFGLLHLINLINGFTIDTIAQVIYATLLGLSFAGVVAYTGSIWPASIVHGLINAVANVNRTFMPNYIETFTSVAVYALFIVLILLVTTLPGLYMLKLSKQRWAGA